MRIEETLLFFLWRKVFDRSPDPRENNVTKGWFFQRRETSLGLSDGYLLHDVLFIVVLGWFIVGKYVTIH